jgi:hypothetical protein
MFDHLLIIAKMKQLRKKLSREFILVAGSFSYPLHLLTMIALIAINIVRAFET